jgi:hypothetical protein
MTMIIAYAHYDKIVMMADSRMSKESKNGDFEYSDDRLKIHPFQRLVLGHSGRSRMLINGNELDISQVIEHFFKINEQNLSSASGTTIIRGLVDTWNNTLIHSMRENPEEHVASLILCEWWQGIEPRIYVCDTLNSNIGIDIGAVIGDQEAQVLVKPYIDVNLNSMSFEETISHFKEAFIEISSKVRTVGGFVNIYVLGLADNEWLEKMPIE